MIDLSKATPDEKELVLGRAFRELHVQTFTIENRGPGQPAHCVTKLVIDAEPVTLIGEPDGCLRVYLEGHPSNHRETVQ